MSTTEDSEASRRVALATTASGGAGGGGGGGGDANVLDMAAMAEQSEVLEAELPARFAAAEAVCERAEDGGLRGSADEQASAVAVAAAEMGRCMLAVRRHAIFSPNEEVEDVNTEDLKYVLGEYHLAKISSRLSPIGGGPAARLAGVRRAAGYMEAFVTRCKQLGLERAGIEVGESVSRAGDPAARRAAKIDRYRMVKAAKARMADLEKRTQEEDGRVDDADRRELVLLSISVAIGDALDSIPMTEEEIKMLEHMVKLHADQQAVGEGAGVLPDAPPQRPPPTEGMWVTHIGPDLVPKREQLRQQVFRPGHNLPTMTLDELADKEIAEATEREAREAIAAETRVMSLEEVEAEGKEDDEGKFNDANLKARNWDDWKDDNTKGSGVTNKC